MKNVASALLHCHHWLSVVVKAADYVKKMTTISQRMKTDGWLLVGKAPDYLKKLLLIQWMKTDFWLLKLTTSGENNMMLHLGFCVADLKEDKWT